jgi:uncharacterized protein
MTVGQTARGEQRTIDPRGTVGPARPSARIRSRGGVRVPDTVLAVREATVTNGTDQVPIGVAETPAERMRGLIGSSAVRGLLLPGARSVHTFGMRTSIDVVLLDRDLAVLEVVRLVPRRFLRPRLRVRHVLELGRSPFRRGDRLKIRDAGLPRGENGERRGPPPI